MRMCCSHATKSGFLATRQFTVSVPVWVLGQNRAIVARGGSRVSGFLEMGFIYVWGPSINLTT